MSVEGTASDPITLAALEKVERDNENFAMMWRRLMAPRPAGPITDAEAMRLFAKGAVQDWLESPL